MNQPNQPAPKSAEEVLREFELDDSIYRNVIIQAIQTYASQFARYVTDEEIDAMFPYLLVGSVREQTKWNEMQEMRRIGAKAMRDMIFGGVKQ